MNSPQQLGIACIGPVQNQANQHSRTDRGTAYEAPPLAEELLTIDGFWETVSQFSIRGWFLVSQWMASHQEDMDHHKFESMSY